MYLKRIALHGFKSFGRQVGAELEPGLNAVVGPNGCGKSNLLDAIRWALGEANLRQLRGGRTEDIIFSGTRWHRPLGFAEVTLTFDNGDRALPLAAAEVSITRRAFRSGQSLFAINGVPCRLRDVHELLARAGFSARSHALVSQGAADGMVLGTGEARRAALEEIAGIARYRHLSSLAGMSRDRARLALQRASAALGEQARHLEFLQGQAARAQEGQEIQRRLATIRFELARRAVKLAQAHAAEAGEARESCLHELAESRENLNKLRQALEARAQEHARLGAQANELRLAQQSRRERLVELRHELLRARDREFEAAGRHERHRQEAAASERQRQELLQEREQAGAATDQAAAALAEAERRLQALQQELAESAAQVGEREQELEKQRSELLRALESLAECRNEHRSARRECEALQARLQELDARREELSRRRQELARRAGEMEREMQKLTADREEAARAEQAVDAQLQDLRARAAACQVELARARAALAGLEEQLRLLRRAHEEREGYSRAVRALMDSDGPWRAALVGPLGDLVRVPEGLEQACAAALGPYVEALVVRSAEAAREAIEFLREHRLGWATFLALDYVRPRGLPPGVQTRLGRLPGYCGLVTERVDVPEQVRPAFEYVAGRIAVVEELRQAIRIGREVPELARIVTLRGEVVVPGGPVSGGFRGPTRAEVLGRAGRLARAEQERRRAADGVEQLQAQAQGLSRRVADLESQQAEYASQRRSAEARMVSLGSQLQAIGAQLHALERQEAVLLAEQHRLAAEQEAAALREQELARRLAEQSGLEQRWREALARLASELEAARARRGQLEQEVVRAFAQVENCRARLEIARARVEQIEREQARLEQAVSHHRQGESQAAAEAEQARQLGARLDAELAAVQAELEETDRAYREVMQRAQEEQGEMEALRREIRRRETEVDDITARYLKVDRTWQQATLRLAEARRLAQQWCDGVQPGEEELADLARASRQELEEQARRQEQQLRDLGAFDVSAISAYEAARVEYEQRAQQKQDVEAALHELDGWQCQLDELSSRRLVRTCQEVGAAFHEAFVRLFGGGEGRLSLEGDRPLEGRVVLQVRPPAKRVQPAVALSGGERALVAAALVFALQKVRPSPVCVLDELDAALDEANLERLVSAVADLAKDRQIVFITHRQRTMQAASALFGVTMDETGVSRLVVLRMGEAPRVSGSALPAPYPPAAGEAEAQGPDGVVAGSAGSREGEEL